MLTASNQVIERNIEHLPSGNVLLCDLPDDDALHTFSELRSDITWFGYTPFFNIAEKNKNQTIWFNAWLAKQDVEQQFDAVIIYYPKTKLRFDYYVSMLSQLLKPTSIIYVVGEKKGGVKSCEKQLKPYAVKANKLDSARHCQLYFAAFNGQADTKSLEDWFDYFDVELEVDQSKIQLTLATLPGVFSAKQLDDGTDLLLKNIKPLTGHGLDVGCGCGVIATAVCQAFGVQVTALDVDAIAVAASNKTFAINEVNAKALASNGLSAVSAKYHFIVSNPPFHTGLKTDYDITENLIKGSKSVLSAKYDYWMVANAFLPYPQHFSRYLKPVKTIANNKRFVIYYTGNTQSN